VISALRLWFIGGWAFAAGYGALVALFTALALRERKLTLERSPGVEPRGLDQYELAMLEKDGDVAAVRLALVNLLHRGILEPGPQWGPRPQSGEPRFSLEVRERLNANAHPLELAVYHGVCGLRPTSAERLLKHLARCDAVARMHARLVDGALLYRKQSALLSSRPFVLLILPYVAFFVFCFSWSKGAVAVSWWELIVNMVALLLGPLLALAVPRTYGATALGSAAALQLGPPEHRDVGRHNCNAVQALIDAYDARFIGL
jgi:uncharacterized protein (TIGR04222 family)